MLSLSSTVGTVDVLARSGFESSQASRNVIHTIINSDTPEVSVRAAMPRAGSFKVLVAAEDADLAREILTSGPPVTYTDTVITGWTMTFVLPEGGEVSVELDETSREKFVITADFLEVAG